MKGLFCWTEIIQLIKQCLLNRVVGMDFLTYSFGMTVEITRFTSQTRKICLFCVLSVNMNMFLFLWLYIAVLLTEDLFI